MHATLPGQQRMLHFHSHLQDMNSIRYDPCPSAPFSSSPQPDQHSSHVCGAGHLCGGAAVPWLPLGGVGVPLILYPVQGVWTLVGPWQAWEQAGGFAQDPGGPALAPAGAAGTGSGTRWGACCQPA